MQELEKIVVQRLEVRFDAEGGDNEYH